MKRHNNLLNSRNQINKINRLYSGAMSRPSLTSTLPRRVSTTPQIFRTTKITRRLNLSTAPRRAIHRRRSLLMGALPMSDRRMFQPRPLRQIQTLRRPILLTGQIAPVRNLQPRRKPLGARQFKLPRQTVICVRRNIRKEVLFAHKAAGRGKKHHRKTLRLNSTSTISCKTRRR